MGKDLEAAFDVAMRNIYAAASTECGYRPTYFLQMVNQRGGLNAARALLARPVSHGFGRLAELGRLDLTVEDLILRPEWADLFSEHERTLARRRLGR